jgi:acyl-CoA hydrolase
MNQAVSETLALWQDKMCTAEQAVKLIKNGQRIFVGTACATPRILSTALEARTPAPEDIELFHYLTTGMLPEINGQYSSKYRHRCFFVGTEMRELVNRGDAEYVPVSLSLVPSLI